MNQVRDCSSMSPKLLVNTAASPAFNDGAPKRVVRGDASIFFIFFFVTSTVPFCHVLSYHYNSLQFSLEGYLVIKLWLTDIVMTCQREVQESSKPFACTSEDGKGSVPGALSMFNFCKR